MRTLALFDFDGTMIRGDSIAALVRRLFLQGHISLPLMLKVLWKTLMWLLGLYPVEALKALSLSPLAAMDAGQVEGILRSFAEKQLQPQIYRDALTQMRKHHAEGHLVMLVSASPLIYLKHLAGFLPADAILGTETDADFKVTRNLRGQEKNRQIARWLQENGVTADFNASFAYGDSANDLDMLGMVGNPRLVNPHRKALKTGKGIPVLYWK